MSKKLEQLQEKALKTGWNLRKIENCKYMFFKNVEGEADVEEYAFNLKDVEIFIKQAEGIYK